MIKNHLFCSIRKGGFAKLEKIMRDIDMEEGMMVHNGGLAWTWNKVHLWSPSGQQMGLSKGREVAGS